MSIASSVPVERGRIWGNDRSVAMAIGLVVLLGVLMSWSRSVAVWQTGTFFDTDDAMRAVQVRDWLAGQGWFDLTQHRLDPPVGLLMHWSRVIDVPLGLMTRFFALFASAEHAERLTRLAFPLVLLACLTAATTWVARILCGPRALWPSAFLLLMSGVTYGEFQPGRIHHHAAQIVLLMLMTGTTLLSLDTRQPRAAALSGLAAAVSLAIGLENMPFVVVLLVVVPAAWAIDASAYRLAAQSLGIGIGVGAPLLFVATVAPPFYGTARADAYSIAHLSVLLIGAAGLLALSKATGCLTRASTRWTLLVLLGATTAAVLVLGFPAAVNEPYYTMDILVRQVWLSHVTEAQSLFRAAEERPATFTVLLCPIAACSVAALVAAWHGRGLDRARWLVLVGLLAMGWVGMAWGIRVASSIQPLAVLGGVWAVVRMLPAADRRPAGPSMVWPVLASLPFCSVAWAFVPEGEMSAEVRSQLAGGVACRDAAALAPLSGFGPDLAFAPIDIGSHLLAHTGLSVLAAPYRSRSGNRAVLQGFMAEPDAARPMIEASHAAYLVLCPGEAQVQVMARLAPHGLAAQLVDGRVPVWLTRLPREGTPYEIYAVH